MGIDYGFPSKKFIPLVDGDPEYTKDGILPDGSQIGHHEIPSEFYPRVNDEIFNIIRIIISNFYENFDDLDGFIYLNNRDKSDYIKSTLDKIYYRLPTVKKISDEKKKRRFVKAVSKFMNEVFFPQYKSWWEESDNYILESAWNSVLRRKFFFFNV